MPIFGKWPRKTNSQPSGWDYTFYRKKIRAEIKNSEEGSLLPYEGEEQRKILDEEMIKDMEEKGIKHDKDKPGVNFLSSTAILKISEVMSYGAKKYEPQNWRKGIEWSRVYAAAMRHLLAWNEGETNDRESGLNHLAHAGCCILFLLDYSKSHPELDDRWKGKSND